MSFKKLKTLTTNKTIYKIIRMLASHPKLKKAIKSL